MTNKSSQLMEMQSPHCINEKRRRSDCHLCKHEGIFCRRVRFSAPFSKGNMQCKVQTLKAGGVLMESLPPFYFWNDKKKQNKGLTHNAPYAHTTPIHV